MSVALTWPGKRLPEAGPAAEVQTALELGPGGWRDRLVEGDNLAALRHLLPELRGQVHAVVLDPPYNTGQDRERLLQPRGEAEVAAPTPLRQYQDLRSPEDWLQFIYERLALFVELLHPEGSLWIHADDHHGHHLRALADELMGPGAFRNEVIWRRKRGRSNATRRFASCTDRLLYYARSPRAPFAPQRSLDTPEAKAHLRSRFTGEDPDGRRFMTAPLVSPSLRPHLRYTYKGRPPPPKGWCISEALMAEWDAAGRLYFPPRGERIYRKVYLDEYAGQPVTDLWTDIAPVNPMARERLGYPTQKPEALAERVLAASTRPGDLVVDGFLGSGTTAAVARRLGRRVLGFDDNPAAIWLSLRRLLADAPPGAPGLALLRAASPEEPLGRVSARLDGDHLELLGFERPGLPPPLRARGRAGWRSLIDAVLIDPDHDGRVLRPRLIDAPAPGALVAARHALPSARGRVAVALVDLLGGLHLHVLN